MRRVIASLLLGAALVVSVPVVSLAEQDVSADEVVTLDDGPVLVASRGPNETEPDIVFGDMLPEIEDDNPVVLGGFFIDADPNDSNNHGADVEWMGTKGISEGWVVPRGREFRGMENVKRCDFAAFLYRLADLADGGKRNSIALSEAKVKSVLAKVSDCNEETPHAAEVAWLINSGISKGWTEKGKTYFRPMATVARQDMAAFLYRYAGTRGKQKQAMGSERLTFSDVRHGDTTNHASEVEWLASIGVTTGWENGTKREFRGMENVKRQDMAAFMHRLHQKVK